MVERAKPWTGLRCPSRILRQGVQAGKYCREFLARSPGLESCPEYLFQIFSGQCSLPGYGRVGFVKPCGMGTHFRKTLVFSERSSAEWWTRGAKSILAITVYAGCVSKLS